MRVIESDLPGILILECVVHGDRRGFFLQSSGDDAARSAGMQTVWLREYGTELGGGGHE